MYTYYKDAQIAIHFTIKNTETSAFSDPAGISVEVKVYGPEGDVLETSEYVYGTDTELTKTSSGTYRLLHTPASSGKLVFGVTTTSPAGFVAEAIVIKDNSI